MILTINENCVPIKSKLKPRFLQQSITVAMASEGPKRVGAILIRGNTIIAAACNNYTKSDAFQARISEKVSIIYNNPEYSKKVYGHAETLALKKVRPEEPDTIVVCRLSGRYNSRRLRLARPCVSCSYLIRNFYPNLKHIHYSTEKGFLYEHWE